MTTPINLNKARKARQRAEKEKRAAENRAKFGQSKSARKAAKAETDKIVRLTDGHRLTPDKAGE